MREQVERQPVAGSVAEREEAKRWTVDTVLALEEKLREITFDKERFDLRGDIIRRVYKTVCTFQNAELALKSIRDYMEAKGVGEEK